MRQSYRFLATVFGLSAIFGVLSAALVSPLVFKGWDQWRRVAVTLLAYSTEASRDLSWFGAIQDMLPGRVEGAAVWVVDENGKVLQSAGDVSLPDWRLFPRPTVPYRAALAPRASTFERSMIIAHLPHGPGAYLVLSGPSLTNASRAVILPLFLFGLWMAAGTAVIATITVVSYFRSRAKEAVDVLARMEHGELGARFRTTRVDEVGKLMLLFNRMADEIQYLIGKLRETEHGRALVLQEISHDIRTPLTAARAALETLETNDSRLEASDRNRCVSIASGELRYVQQLIEDLFFLAEIEEPRYREELEEVNLVRLIQPELERRESRASEEEKTVRWRLVADGEPTVLGSPSLLLRLVRNALDNAARYAASEVTISVREALGRIALVVDDDGPGVSEEECARFGERRTTRFHAGTFSSGQSIGLGSVIMRRIAERHQGSVVLKNWQRPDGRRGGARVLILMPQAQRPVARAA